MRLTSRQLLVLGLVALLALAGVFGVQAYQSWQALQTARGTGLRDASTIRAWMSVRYVARTYGVSETALESQLGVSTGPRTTLLDLARRRGVPARQVVAETRQAVVALRASGPTPAPALAPPPRPSP